MKPKTPQERNELWKMRQKAQKIMKELPLMLEGIARTSSHPERDYNRIFQDEASYFRMIEVCKQKYDESFKATSKLRTPEAANHIIYACLASGIPAPSIRQLQDRHIFFKTVEELKKHRTPDGITRYEQLIQRMQHDKYSKTDPYRKPRPNTT